MLSRLFCFVMSVVVLNASIDISDSLLYSDSQKKSASEVNEMESMAEWVAECVFDMENAFPEKRDDDSNNNLFKKLTGIKYLHPFVSVHIPQQPCICLNFKSYIPFHFSRIMFEILTPPPRF